MKFLHKRYLKWATIGMILLGNESACDPKSPNTTINQGRAPVQTAVLEALPRAEPRGIAIIVAGFEADEDQNRDGEGDYSSLVTQGLRELNQRVFGPRPSKPEFRAFQILRTNRILPIPRGPDPDRNLELGHEEARKWLDETGGSVLIWGKVLRGGSFSVPLIYITGRRVHGEGIRYPFEQSLDLPESFVRDLSAVIALTALTEFGDFDISGGVYVADDLLPFIEKVEAVLQAPKMLAALNAESRGGFREVLGKALLVYGQQKGDRIALEKAEETYREATRDFERETSPLEWARMRAGRALALMLLAEFEADDSKLSDSIVLFREVLGALFKMHQREQAPLDWAAIQNNLGNALLALGERESGTKSIRQAVNAYKQALMERTREGVPLDWASTQNNLGNALLALGERESGMESIREAVVAYKLALTERTRERVPLDWASTQNNLGNALRTLGERESGTKHLEEAVEAYRLALLEKTRERVPLDWASTQLSLSNTLKLLTEEGHLAFPDQVVEACRMALLVYKRELVPLHWASAQHTLGDALQLVGDQKGDVQYLIESVDAYRQALFERTRERLPLAWAQTQHALGNALQALGELQNDKELLQDAISAYESALWENTVQVAPYAWSKTQLNLGSVFQALSLLSNDRKLLKRAIATYKAVLQVLPRSQEPFLWAETQNNLGVALRWLGVFEKSTAVIRDAVMAHEEALKVFTKDLRPLRWATAQFGLAVALTKLGQQEHKPVHFEKAVAAFDDALTNWTRERSPRDWAIAQNNKGQALALLGLQRKDSSLICEALQVHLQAWQEFDKLKNEINAEFAARNAQIDLTGLKHSNPKQKPNCPQVPDDLWQAFQQRKTKVR